MMKYLIEYLKGLLIKEDDEKSHEVSACAYEQEQGNANRANTWRDIPSAVREIIFSNLPVKDRLSASLIDRRSVIPARRAIKYDPSPNARQVLSHLYSFKMHVSRKTQMVLDENGWLGQLALIHQKNIPAKLRMQLILQKMDKGGSLSIEELKFSTIAASNLMLSPHVTTILYLHLKILGYGIDSQKLWINILHCLNHIEHYKKKVYLESLLLMAERMNRDEFDVLVTYLRNILNYGDLTSQKTSISVLSTLLPILNNEQKISVHNIIMKKYNDVRWPVRYASAVFTQTLYMSMDDNQKGILAQTLYEMLNQNDELTLSTILVIIEEIGDQIIPPLANDFFCIFIKCLQSKSLYIRHVTIKCLSKMMAVYQSQVASIDIFKCIFKHIIDNKISVNTCIPIIKKLLQVLIDAGMQSQISEIILSDQITSDRQRIALLQLMIDVPELLSIFAKNWVIDLFNQAITSNNEVARLEVLGSILDHVNQIDTSILENIAEDILMNTKHLKASIRHKSSDIMCVMVSKGIIKLHSTYVDDIFQDIHLRFNTSNHDLINALPELMPKLDSLNLENIFKQIQVLYNHHRPESKIQAIQSIGYLAIYLMKPEKYQCLEWVKRCLIHEDLGIKMQACESLSRLMPMIDSDMAGACVWPLLDCLDEVDMRYHAIITLKVCLERMSQPVREQIIKQMVYSGDERWVWSMRAKYCVLSHIALYCDQDSLEKIAADLLDGIVSDDEHIRGECIEAIRLIVNRFDTKTRATFIKPILQHFYMNSHYIKQSALHVLDVMVQDMSDEQAKVYFEPYAKWLLDISDGTGMTAIEPISRIWSHIHKDEKTSYYEWVIHVPDDIKSKAFHLNYSTNPNLGV